MNQRLIFLIFVFSSIFIFSRYLNEIELQINSDNLEIKTGNIINHVNQLIEIGNSEESFENSRIKAREYIRDYMVDNGIPQDNIIYNKFEWSERKADGKLITTTTWTGINIIIWSNTTINTSKKIRVIGGHYDTLNWGLNKTSGAHSNLAGVGMIIESVIEFFKHQQQSGDKETPFMFVLFDQEEPGALGSKSFVDYYKIAKNNKDFAYFLDIDSIGYRNSLGPILQTYPYEHKSQVLFSPAWLINRMVQSAYQVAENGIQVGHASILGSIIYQAHRYHLFSIPYLSDDGPFTWNGVDSILFTDLDVFYTPNGNPDYHQLTDQVVNIDQEQLKLSSEIIGHFLISTSTEESLLVGHHSTDLINKLPTNYWSPILRVIYNQIQTTIMEKIFSGHKQYLVIGPICFNYFEILSGSLLMISIIYYTSFQKYRSIVDEFASIHSKKNKKQLKNSDDEILADESDNTTKKPTISAINKKLPFFEGIIGHRLLFIHLFALTITVLFDTVYTFEIICLGFIGLLTIPQYKYNINVFTGIISAVLSAQFIYKDFTQINQFSKKGSSSHQLTLYGCLVVYILNVILLTFYGHHYTKKRNFLLKEFKKTE